MARPVMLGNGSLTVGLNEHGMVHDFYYPYVGLDNLTTARSVHHKIGIWIDGSFSWVDDGSWHISVDFETDALISTIVFKKESWQIELKLQDFVDADSNVFCRRIHVDNQADHYRNIRLFMHQVFQISSGGRGDTALYEPEENYLLDYKGRCSLLIYAQNNEGIPFDQYCVGNYGIEGKEGTFKDAEDGELAGNPIEHGGVDSVLGLSAGLSAHESTQFEYWIVAADSQYAAEKLHLQIKQDGLEQRMEATRTYWHEWHKSSQTALLSIDEEYRAFVQKSLMVIKVHTDKRGGVIASCDSSIYNYGRDYYSYVWPRDGAYAMWPLIRMGHTEEPKRFFEFCRDIITRDGYMMHKYQPDRAIGSTWHPLVHGRRTELAIQEDETAIIVFMLGQYLEYSHDKDFVYDLYLTFIRPATNFLTEFVDAQTQLPHASYDLWEEKFLTTTYTAAVVYQALAVAAEFAEMFEYPDDAARWQKSASDIAQNSAVFFDPERRTFRKGYLLAEDGSLKFDNTIDVSSMYGVMMYADEFGKDKLAQTVTAIESTLLDISPSGGTVRYEYDHYFESRPAYMGNPWFVTTLWMAQYYARNGQMDKARHYVAWSMSHALDSGILSEQVNPSNGLAVSVTPLVWSHAEYINTVLDIAQLSRTDSN